MVDTWDNVSLHSELTTDEGVRFKPYTDTTGNLSIGVGRNLRANGISTDECDLMLNNDIAHAVAGLDKTLPWWRELDGPRQRVMINLTFNMGIAGLSAFHGFLTLMRAHRYADAAADLGTTLWFRQVGARGPLMLARLKA